MHRLKHEENENTRQRQCLSHKRSGSTQQRQCLSHEGSGSTRQRHCLYRPPALTMPAELPVASSLQHVFVVDATPGRSCGCGSEGTAKGSGNEPLPERRKQLRPRGRDNLAATQGAHSLTQRWVGTGTVKMGERPPQSTAGRQRSTTAPREAGRRGGEAPRRLGERGPPDGRTWPRSSTHPLQHNKERRGFREERQ